MKKKSQNHCCHNYNE